MLVVAVGVTDTVVLAEDDADGVTVATVVIVEDVTYATSKSTINTLVLIVVY